MKRSKGTTVLLTFFLGFFGIHKYYLGLPMQGVLHIPTAVFFPLGIAWWIIDIFYYALMEENNFHKKFNGHTDHGIQVDNSHNKGVITVFNGPVKIEKDNQITDKKTSVDVRLF